MDEIQRRWFAGETEASIHAAHTHRDATPAWPVVRADSDGAAFTYATDERTMAMQGHQKRGHDDGDKANPALWRKMRAFVKNYLSRHRGEQRQHERREVEEAPVLKPRKGLRYSFTA
ncbi:hypothetical protein LTR37_015045 [Vermiconidia calcicola]|uniref:Uncharacterized protein n=1 Tax=Vermiconidia calcicola TaxID=1690605 RepID=A0ACC3MTF4_9PEZI|nr:hypothetical protein LTR37_015045 [Vermiconidia calcicola]